jgi:hypothetical protein
VSDEIAMSHERDHPKCVLAVPAFVLLTLVLAGCARYEYHIVEPADQQMRIGREVRTLPIEPLEYSMQTYDNRLVVHVRNPLAEPVQLLGHESYVVDPHGQSFPLRTQTIAPGSYVKLILPPMPPRIYRGGPRFGVGVGLRVHHYRRHHYPYWGYYDPFFYPYHPAFYPPAYDGPHYLDVGSLDPTYWEWRGQTTVRILLRYLRGNQRFGHEFVIDRVRAR